MEDSVVRERGANGELFDFLKNELPTLNTIHVIGDRKDEAESCREALLRKCRSFVPAFTQANSEEHVVIFQNGTPLLSGSKLSLNQDRCDVRFGALPVARMEQIFDGPISSRWITPLGNCETFIQKNVDWNE